MMTGTGFWTVALFPVRRHETQVWLDRENRPRTDN